MRHPRIRRSLTVAVTVAALIAAAACAALAQTAPGAGQPAADPATEKPAVDPKTVPSPKEEGRVPYNILEEADEDMFLSLAGWSTKYRTSPELEDGDWVKYESVGEGPKETLEIRASKTEEGTWIIEKRTVAGQEGSTELHLLFTPGKPKLLRAFRVAADGTREDIEPLDEITSGELFLEARQMAFDALGGDRTKFKVYNSGDVQKLVGPFGEMLCRSVEMVVAEDVDPASFERVRRWLSEGTLLWLNEDVPRLIPMSSVLLPALVSPDDLMTVQGGLVRSTYHVLVDYKGRK